LADILLVTGLRRVEIVDFLVPGKQGQLGAGDEIILQAAILVTAILPAAAELEGVFALHRPGVAVRDEAVQRGV